MLCQFKEQKRLQTATTTGKSEPQGPPRESGRQRARRDKEELSPRALELCLRRRRDPDRDPQPQLQGKGMKTRMKQVQKAPELRKRRLDPCFVPGPGRSNRPCRQPDPQEVSRRKATLSRSRNRRQAQEELGQQCAACKRLGLHREDRPGGGHRKVQLNESTLGQVPSANHADNATFAESASPLAFAAVDQEGGVDPANSKGQIAVSQGKEAGILRPQIEVQTHNGGWSKLRFTWCFIGRGGRQGCRSFEGLDAVSTSIESSP